MKILSKNIYIYIIVYGEKKTNKLVTSYGKTGETVKINGLFDRYMPQVLF